MFVQHEPSWAPTIKAGLSQVIRFHAGKNVFAKVLHCKLKSVVVRILPPMLHVAATCSRSIHESSIETGVIIGATVTSYNAF